jgi:formiminotetrahydrofolate cyclodeaminase
MMKADEKDIQAFQNLINSYLPKQEERKTLSSQKA